MKSLAGEKKLNIVIMEPSTFIKYSMQMLLEEIKGINLKSAVSSFKVLEVFLSFNASIDAVICEMYDHTNNILEGILKIRHLLSCHPQIKFYLYTNVICKKLHKQCYVQEVFSKSMSIHNCCIALKKMVEKKSDPIKFPDIISLNDELSASELRVLISFSHYHDLKRVSLNTGLSYKYVSHIKRKIMKKTGVKNNSEFNLMLAEVEKKTFNLLGFS